MVVSGSESMGKFHAKLYAIGLIVIWLRFMRSCRVFQTLGPFIAILGLLTRRLISICFKRGCFV